jgi:hypothetical protein
VHELVGLVAEWPENSERFTIGLEKRYACPGREEPRDHRAVEGMAPHHQEVPDLFQRYLLRPAVPLHDQDPGSSFYMSSESGNKIPRDRHVKFFSRTGRIEPGV